MIVLIFLGTLLIGVAYGSAWLPGGAPMWGTWCMIIGCAITIAAATTFGALRSGARPMVARCAGIFLLAVIVAGFGVPVLLPPDTANGALLLGLPLRVAIEVYGVGVLPALVLPALFALEFRRR